MTTNRNWCWHLGLASSLAIGGAIAYPGEYAFAQNVDLAQNVDCNLEPPTSDIYLLNCTASLPHTVPGEIGSQPGNTPGGIKLDLLELKALPSATILKPQALPSATILKPQALQSAIDLTR